MVDKHHTINTLNVKQRKLSNESGFKRRNDNVTTSAEFTDRRFTQLQSTNVPYGGLQSTLKHQTQGKQKLFENLESPSAKRGSLDRRDANSKKPKSIESIKPLISGKFNLGTDSWFGGALKSARAQP